MKKILIAIQTVRYILLLVSLYSDLKSRDRKDYLDINPKGFQKTLYTKCPCKQQKLSFMQIAVESPRKQFFHTDDNTFAV